MIKAIIFDFDNTLEDFKSVKRRAELKVGKYLSKKFNLNLSLFVSTFEEVDLYFSHKGAKINDIRVYDRAFWFKETFKRLKFTQKLSKNEINLLSSMYWRYINKNAKSIKGVKPALVKLNKKFKLIIMSDSDGSRKIKIDRIKNCGIYKYISYILLGDDVKANKPDIKFYKKIFKRYNLKPSECIMVGDKPEVDLKLAKSIGMFTVWIRFGAWSSQLKDKHFRYVDHEIKDFTYFPRIVKKIENEQNPVK
ncbi:HAD family hydrolase [Candidatus Woesearchaeota archaeon]|nr:HAD family hydrolase [Candidatus Woesearchaeota archaeon]